MNDGWQVNQVGREGLANVTAAPVRTLLLFAVFAIGMSGIILAELDVTGKLLTETERLQARGGYVVLVGGVDEPLPAAACEAVRTWPAVVGAGGEGDALPVRFTSAPGVEFQVRRVTSGLIDVWYPGAELPTGGGYVLGSAAAEELGVRTGDHLAPSGSSPSLVTVPEPEDRNRFASRSVLDVAPATGAVDTCWVEFRPDTATAGPFALPAAFPGIEIAVHPLLRVDPEFARDAVREFGTRPQAHAWLPVAALLAFVVSAFGFMRRSEAAVYRAFGLPRLGVLLIHQTETIITATAAFLLGATWTVAGYAAISGVPEPGQVAIALRSGGKTLLLLVVAGPVLASLTTRGEPATLLKDGG